MMPKEWLIENYKDALLGGKVLGYLGNSVFVTFVVIIASTVLISMVAYAVTRMKWKLRGVTYWFFMAGLTIPVPCYLLPLFIILKRLNILNTPLAIIIPSIRLLHCPLGLWYLEIIMHRCRTKWRKLPV